MSKCFPIVYLQKSYFINIPNKYSIHLISEISTCGQVAPIAGTNVHKCHRHYGIISPLSLEYHLTFLKLISHLTFSEVYYNIVKDAGTLLQKLIKSANFKFFSCKNNGQYQYFSLLFLFVQKLI